MNNPPPLYIHGIHCTTHTKACANILPKKKTRAEVHMRTKHIVEKGRFFAGKITPTRHPLLTYGTNSISHKGVCQKKSSCTKQRARITKNSSRTERG